MEITFGFVILHYCSLDDTVKCVESIYERFDLASFHIVIVDNASPNASGKQLLQKYNDKKDCHIIINERNLGFAKGNNVGFRYAKNILGCNMICMMNSDVCLIMDNMGQAIIADYNKYHFAVLGPDIITSDNVQCNPQGRHVLSLKETKKNIHSLKIQLLLNRFNLDELIRNLIRKHKKGKAEREIFLRDHYYEDVKLHGCCWIFSNDYIQKYDGLNEGTFLYAEEDFLYLLMMQDGQKTLYSPNVQVFHAECGSTNYVHHGRKKRRFVLENHVVSMKAIRDYLENN